MRLSDTVIGCGLFAVSVIAFQLASSFPSVPGMRFGAGTFPLVISAVLGACGLFLAVSSILQRSPRTQSATPSDAPWRLNEVANLLIVMAAPLFYIFAASRVGFFLTSVVVVFMLSIRLWGGLLRSAVLALVCASLTEVIFGGMFGVPLPKVLFSIRELLG